MPYIVIGGVLYHYGIPNMRWGHRRFQNKDGSLTEAGKRRYAKGIEKQARSKNTPKGNLTRVGKMIAEDFASGKFGDKYDAKIKDTAATVKKLLNDQYMSEIEFEDSDEYLKASKEAEKRAVKYFEDNDPDRLKEMRKISKDTGRDLMSFGDFDDIHSYYMYDADDNTFEAYREKFFKANGVDIEASTKAYKQACKDLTDAVLGQYGNVIVHHERSGDALAAKLEEYLGEAAFYADLKRSKDG